MDVPMGMVMQVLMGVHHVTVAMFMGMSMGMLMAVYMFVFMFMILRHSVLLVLYYVENQQHAAAPRFPA
jgi:hypothetical protein